MASHILLPDERLLALIEEIDAALSLDAAGFVLDRERMQCLYAGLSELGSFRRVGLPAYLLGEMKWTYND